ncbi:MAG TPA: DUF1800 domain-containing protein [Rectinemataceae bacterium]|nr:DUF1800 domain-containing protein [Rectinemataceae bacterium]
MLLSEPSPGTGEAITSAKTEFFLLILALSTVAGSALSLEDASHLSQRTGLGSPPPELMALAPLDRDQAVDYLLSRMSTEPSLPPPAWAQPPYLTAPAKPGHPADVTDRKAFQLEEDARRQELRVWFVDELVHSPAPLSDKLLLFWHNHFTSSLEKTNSAELMLEQDLLLRKYSFGHFGDLLRAISVDPAMVIYLDGESNVKGKPNENYARELLELFTVGEGHYTEDDIKAAARAFTGWIVDRAQGLARFVPSRHDDGMKTFLGQTGPWKGEDIIRIILEQDSCAYFITQELWTYFISPAPDPDQVKRIAADFKASGYDIRGLVRELLTSDAFWAPGNRAVLVKSPAELLIGFIRSWGITGYDPRRIAGELGRLGQDLFNPLSVKGWPVGEDWIDASTLLERRRDLSELSQLVRAQAQAPEGNLE